MERYPQTHPHSHEMILATFWYMLQEPDHQTVTQLKKAETAEITGKDPICSAVK